MPTLTVRKNLILGHGHGMRWAYAVIFLGAAVNIFSVAKFAVLPLIVRRNTIAVTPIAPLVPSAPAAAPGLATATLLTDLQAQNLGAAALGYVTHRYLAGRGVLIGFGGDNIQIFEYPTAAIASAEAAAIFTRAPRLTKENLFHIYLHENLIGLYFGHDEAVMRVAGQEMGSPLATR